MTPAPPPDPLAALDAAGRRLRRAAFGGGMLKTVAVAGASALAAAIADATVGGFTPDGLRTARWALVAATLAAAVRWLWGPLVRRPNRAALAAAADRAGGANDRLATVLSSSAAASGPLRDRLLDVPVPAPPPPRRGRLRWALASLILCAVAIGGWTVAAPATATASVTRVIGTAGAERLRLEVGGRLVPRGRSEIRLPAGAEVTIRAFAPGRRTPDAVRWRAAGATTAPVDGGGLRVAVGDRRATLAASADGFRPALLTVRPLVAAAVLRVTVSVTPPGGETVVIDSPTAVSAAPGDRVRIEVVASHTKETRLVLPPEGPAVTRTGGAWELSEVVAGDWPVGVALVPEANSFLPRPSGGSEPVRPLFVLRVREDAPPSVELTEPAEGLTVTPAAAVRVAAVAGDDRPGVRLELLFEGQTLFAKPPTAETTAAAAADVSDLSNRLPGEAFAVSAVATDARGQQTRTPPRTVGIVSPEEKRAALEAAVAPWAAALTDAAGQAGGWAEQAAEGTPPESAEVRRGLERLGAEFAAPTRDGLNEARRNGVTPGSRLAAAGRELERTPAVRAAADRLRAALRRGDGSAIDAAGELATRLADSAARLQTAVDAADGAVAARTLRDEQVALTERTADVIGTRDGDAAALAETQRTIAAALGDLRNGPAAESLRAAARDLAAGRFTDAVARQREALARWDEAANRFGVPSPQADPAATGELLRDLAVRQRAAAAALDAVVQSGAVGRRALRALRAVGDAEEAVAEELRPFAAARDPATAAAANQSAEDAAAVAAGITERRPAADLSPLAKRAAARLEALLAAAAAMSPAGPNGGEARPGDSPSPDGSTAASPTEPEAGTLPDANDGDPSAAGVAGSNAGLGGSAGGPGSPADDTDRAAVPWGRLPDRLRERLSNAADASAAPGFADLTARYRARLGGFAPPPSLSPTSPP